MNIPEGFVKVKNWEPYYINEHGDLFSSKRGGWYKIKQRFRKSVPYYALKYNGKHSDVSAARLVYEAFTNKDVSEKCVIFNPHERKPFHLKNLKLSTGSKNEFNRTYSVNHDYFNNIDSHEKAYLLGLMYSDGCVGKTNNIISYVSADHDMINFFRDKIGCTRKLIPNVVRKKCLYITFPSSRMKSDLIRLGCMPQKSLIVNFPSFDQVPKPFIWSFVLGYFDGDGCISGQKQTQVKIISSTLFCQGLKQLLEENGIKTAKVTTEPKRLKPETSYIRITNRKGIAAFKQKIYEHAPFILKRKYDRFL